MEVVFNRLHRREIVGRLLVLPHLLDDFRYHVTLVEMNLTLYPQLVSVLNEDQIRLKAA